MKIAFITYSSAYQRVGGLQNQIKETKVALETMGHLVDYFDEKNNRLSDYDIVHIFSIAHGNYTWVDECVRQKVPCILSAVMQTTSSFFDMFRFKLANFVVGGLLLRKYHPLSSLIYKNSAIRNGIFSADFIIALSKAESMTIASFFDVPVEKLKVIPNGVNKVFSFDPTVKKKDYIFIPASIYPHKNQLAIVHVASKIGIQVKLAGEILNNNYFQKLLRYENVEYVGEIASNSAQMVRMYREAKVTALTSLGETFGLILLESLACGTPVVFTNKTPFKEISQEFCQYVDPLSEKEIKVSLEYFLNSETDSFKISKIVERYSWENIAEQLLDLYQVSLKAKI
jgi:glycosyltransferase involved in cell wall biosynthesis